MAKFGARRISSSKINDTGSVKEKRAKDGPEERGRDRVGKDITMKNDSGKKGEKCPSDGTNGQNETVIQTSKTRGKE